MRILIARLCGKAENAIFFIYEILKTFFSCKLGNNKKIVCGDGEILAILNEGLVDLILECSDCSDILVNLLFSVGKILSVKYKCRKYWAKI